MNVGQILEVHSGWAGPRARQEVRDIRQTGTLPRW